MRRFFVALVLVLAIYLVFSRFAQAAQVWATLQQGNPFWLLLAGLTQLAWLVDVGETYRFVYRLLGMEISLRQVLLLVATGNFVNVAAPSGGVGGMAIFVADGRRRGLSPSRVTVAWALFLVFDYFGFLCVLALGLLVMVRRNRLDPASLSAAFLLFLLALALADVLILGARSAARLEQVLLRWTRLINRLLRPFLRRDYLSEARAHTFATGAAEGLSALRTHWQRYLMPAALGLLSKLLLIGVLFLTFLAFNQPFSPGTLIAGFSISYLFLVVSPTPAGLGFVEGIMPLTLIALSIPQEPAFLVTLAYRGLTFWLPLGYGFIAFRLWQRHFGQP